MYTYITQSIQFTLCTLRVNNLIYCLFSFISISSFILYCSLFHYMYTQFIYYHVMTYLMCTIIFPFYLSLASSPSLSPPLSLSLSLPLSPSPSRCLPPSLPPPLSLPPDSEDTILSPSLCLPQSKGSVITRFHASMNLLSSLHTLSTNPPLIIASIDWEEDEVFLC